MNDIAFKVIIKNDGIDDVIFKTIMLKGEKGDKGDAGGAEIDDSTTSSTKTWSSNKIRNEIDAKPVNLSQLGDVDLDTITDGQMLGYNLSAGKWENKDATASSLKYDANTSIKSKIDEKANTADLATVATSGEYNDLSNKPSIPPAQVNADWNASSGVAKILNKPTIPVVDQTLNPSSSNAISNSAVANGLSGKADTSSLSTVATSGDYSDLLNKPIHFRGTLGLDVMQVMKDLPDNSICCYTDSNNPTNQPTGHAWGSYFMYKTNGGARAYYTDNDCFAVSSRITSSSSSITWKIYT